MKRRRVLEICGQCGFTIIESTLIILIIGLMAVIAVPRILLMDRNVVYASSRQIIADMRYARSLAITEVVEHIVLFSVDPIDSSRYDKYEIFRGDGVGNPDGNAVKSMEIPEKVVCTPAAGFSGKLCFNPLGGSDRDGDIVSLVTGSHQHTISAVGATGRVYENE